VREMGEGNIKLNRMKMRTNRKEKGYRRTNVMGSGVSTLCC